MNVKLPVSKRMIVLLTLINLYLMSGSTFAASDLESKTTLRKLELQSHEQRIQSTSLEEAIAATEVGLNSGDQELRTMTLQAALGSDNLRVQTTALRWIFSEGKKLIFQLIDPNSSDKGTNYTYKLWRGHVLKGYQFDPITNEITLRKSNFNAGYLIRGGFQLEYKWYPERIKGYRCTFMAVVDQMALKNDRIQLKGNIDCIFPPLEKHPAKGDEDGIVAFVINLS
jgi:hypothetical protein